MARLFFCLVPALVGAAIFSVLNPALGVFAFMFAWGVGWSVTERKPERGE